MPRRVARELPPIQLGFEDELKEGETLPQSAVVLHAFLAQCESRDERDIPREFRPFVALSRLSLELAEATGPIDFQRAQSHIRSLQVMGPLTEVSEKRELVHGAVIAHDLQHANVITPPLSERGEGRLAVKQWAKPGALLKIGYDFVAGKEHAAAKMVRQQLDIFPLQQIADTLSDDPGKLSNEWQLFPFADYIAHRTLRPGEEEIRDKTYGSVLHEFSTPSFFIYKLDRVPRGRFLDEVVRWGEEHGGTVVGSPLEKWFGAMRTVIRNERGMSNYAVGRVLVFTHSNPRLEQLYWGNVQVAEAGEHEATLNKVAGEVDSYMVELCSARVDPQLLTPEMFFKMVGGLHMRNPQEMDIVMTANEQVSCTRLYIYFRNLEQRLMELSAHIDIKPVLAKMEDRQKIYSALTTRVHHAVDEWERVHAREIVLEAVKLISSRNERYAIPHALEGLVVEADDVLGPLLNTEAERLRSEIREEDRLQEEQTSEIERMLEVVRARLGVLQERYSAATGLALDYRPEAVFEHGSSVGSISVGMGMRLSQRLELRQYGSVEDTIDLQMGDTVEEAREREAMVDWVGPHEFGHAVDWEESEMADEIVERAQLGLNKETSRLGMDEEERDGYERVLRECVMDGFGLALALEAGTSYPEDVSREQRTQRIVQGFLATIPVLERIWREVDEGGEEEIPHPANRDRSRAVTRYLAQLPGLGDGQVERLLALRFPRQRSSRICDVYRQVVEQAYKRMVDRLS